MRSSWFKLSVDLPIILRDLGLLVPVVGLMAILSLPVCLAFNEGYAILPLIITAALSFALGACLYLPFRNAGEAKLRHGLVIAAFGWLLVAGLGSLPLVLITIFAPQGGAEYAALGYFRDPLNAFFESVSGFTTTGLTMTARADLLPHIVQWWRSFMQWIGGMGVIVLMLAILAGPRPGSYSLYYAEARGEKIHPSVMSTLRTMWWIFLLYTFVSVVLLWGAGMPLWDSLNHAMTGMSTGGFSVTGNSIASYNSLAIELVMLPIMLFGAISFAVHYSLMLGKGGTLWRDSQTRWLIIIVSAGVLLLALENGLQLGLLRSLRESAFQFFSAMTTTGFQTANVGSWSATAKLLLAAGMFVGGAAGSTAGGIKLMRMLILAKGVQWRLRKIVSPRGAIVPFRLNGTTVNEEEVGNRLEDATLIAFLWLVFLLAGVLVLLHTAPPHFTLSDIIFEVASAQDTVGMSVGITGPMMPTVSKLALCFNMWIGRLEIIPVLMLFRSLFLGLQ
ncbi:MAG: TrkH family potassium uptake protein [Candidatus Bipolaricaulota bacterium]|nr:TrkH family potassium uptake protein [Candidatus Bipolaricaulota bacterium]